MTREGDPDPAVRVGVSSCLLGEEVRYDGRHKREPYLTEVLGGRVRFVPVCPELDIGLGVPREPIHLLAGPGDVRLVGVDSGDDHTVSMRTYGERRVDELRRAGLDGYVLKSRSPSCGPGDVPVHDAVSGEVVDHVRGRFAAVLVDRIPDLPVTGEDRLADAAERDRFLERLCVRHRWRRCLGDDPSLDGLADMHARHELQVHAHSPDAHRELVALVGGAGRTDLDVVAGTYRRVLHGALDEPTTRDRHVEVLRHLVGMLDDGDPDLQEAVDGYAAGRTGWPDVAERLRRTAPRAPLRFGAQTYLDPLAEVGLTPTSW